MSPVTVRSPAPCSLPITLWWSSSACSPSERSRRKEPSTSVRHEFSVRAVLCGLVVALVMGASYPYMVLKLGFGPNVSVVAAFLGYIVLGIAFKDYNRWENNIVQTAGT